MYSGIKLTDTKLETKVNTFVEHIILDKGKPHNDSFMPDHLSFKTNIVKTDHKNVEYRTKNVLWRPRQTAFGRSTAEKGNMTMPTVHLIGENRKTAQYKVSY